MAVHASAHACQALDSEFERRGPIISTNTVSTDPNAQVQKVGDSEYLEGLLDALPAYPVGRPKPISVRITIDANTQKMRIFANLAGGIRGPEFEQEVVCTNDRWSFSKSVTGGGEGGYWEAQYTVTLNTLPNGDLEVKREGKKKRGLVFHSETSANVVARFKRL